MRTARSRQLAVLFPLVVAACGGATTDAEQRPEPTNAPVNADFPLTLKCRTTTDSRWDAVTPSEEFDGFEVRRLHSFGPDAGVEATRTLKPLCTKAKDAAACAERAAAASRDERGWDAYGPINNHRGHAPELVVATKGDDVLVIGTLEELAPAIAPIETAQEAALLAMLRDSLVPYCLPADSEVTAARVDGDAFELILRKYIGCAGRVDEAVVRVERDGTYRVLSEQTVTPAKKPGPVCGRRPTGLAPLEDGEPTGLAGLLAKMAWLEAASVPAFAALAQDLARHGAPTELVERALAARSDEIMHARLTREAARRHGALPESPRVPRAKPRTLFELALENAVEGCVREAFGALVATHQAEHAADPSLRAMFAAIAKDETEHAALSLDLAEWIDPLLTAAERDAVAEARESAFAELERALVNEPSREEIALGGMPSQTTAKRLLDALRRLDLDGRAA
jgi:hypothetical protein